MFERIRRLWRQNESGLVVPAPIVRPLGWSRRDFLRQLGVTTLVSVGGLGLARPAVNYDSIRGIESFLDPNAPVILSDLQLVALLTRSWMDRLQIGYKPGALTKEIDDLEKQLGLPNRSIGFTPEAVQRFTTIGLAMGEARSGDLIIVPAGHTEGT